ncbi:hypothetical protein [Halolamina sp. C58]|uniref:hypothetical protein n=1 Tax=Halolamina sp. C58 TaxID=3421640 RepID=UPI003EB74689
MARTRRQALLGAGALLAGLSGCSGVDDGTATPTATAGERTYDEGIGEPVSRTVRTAAETAAVRSTLVDPVGGWTDSQWLVADRDDREALYFADGAAGVDAALSLIEDTEFASALVLVHQHPVDACERWELERLAWGEDADAPAGSADVELRYRAVDREADCEPDPRGDVAATFVRVPARFERVTSFGVRVS